MSGCDDIVTQANEKHVVADEVSYRKRNVSCALRGYTFRRKRRGPKMHLQREAIIGERMDPSFRRAIVQHEIAAIQGGKFTICAGELLFRCDMAASHPQEAT